MFNLKTNLNKYSKDAGVYSFTQKCIEKLKDDKEFQKVWERSIAMVDEYDSFFFEGALRTMLAAVNIFKQCGQVIGFTGSTLIEKELQCLKLAFKNEVVVIPLLSQICTKLVK